MSRPDSIPKSRTIEGNTLPQGAKLATEKEVNTLPPEAYFDNVAFDVKDKGNHVVFQNAQDRNNFVAKLNE